MIEASVSAEEIEESDYVIHRFREKHMCDSGPVIQKAIEHSLRSTDARVEFPRIIEQFMNTGYFRNSGEVNIALSSKDTLGVSIWQGHCTASPLTPFNDGSMLTFFFSNNVFLPLDQFGIASLSLDPAYFETFNDDRGIPVVQYHYDLELVFSNLEEVFFLTRSFWYFIEAALIHEVLNNAHKYCMLSLMQQYLSLRRLLIDPFIYVQFPERIFFTKIIVPSESELMQFYEKKLFSKLRSVQKKSLFVAKMIKNEMENKK